MAQRRFDDPEPPLVGIPMSEDDFERLISGETSRRYELIDEILYDMTGSTPEHADLSGQIETSFRLQLSRSGPCRSYQEQYVAIPGHTPLCPDVVITCDISDRDKDKRLKPFRIQSPLLIVEVLSPSTERHDRTAKFALYQTCPTLEAYILASQFKPLIEVYRRSNNWQQELFSAGQIVHLDQLDLELNVDEIYEGVL